MISYLHGWIPVLRGAVRDFLLTLCIRALYIGLENTSVGLWSCVCVQQSLAYSPSGLSILLTREVHAESVCNGCYCRIGHRACQAVCAVGERAFIDEQRLRHV